MVWSRFTRHFRKFLWFTNSVRTSFQARRFLLSDSKAFQKCSTKIHHVSFFRRSLRWNQIDELPAGVFSTNNKLLNLWVGRLKVNSRHTYFYCKILPQILVNSNILKYYRTTTSCLIIWLLISQATIVLKEESYLLADHWSRVLKDIFVSDLGRFRHIFIPRQSKPNKFSSWYTLLERVRLRHLDIFAHYR